MQRQGKPQPAGSSLFYEFLLRPDEKLVLYRAVVDKTVFVYPLQQPVSDFGVLKEKLTTILSKTGWCSIAASGEGDDTIQQKMDSAKQNLWNTFIWLHHDLSLYINFITEKKAIESENHNKLLDRIF